LQASVQAHITRTSSDSHTECAIRDNPSLQGRVPDRQIISGKIKLHRLAVTHVQENGVKATKNLRRGVRVLWEVEVELRNLVVVSVTAAFRGEAKKAHLCAISIAFVSNVEGDGGNILMEALRDW
jgi:hypothetical protein